MVYLIYFVILLSPFATFAGVPKEQCANLDYSSRFGPVRDQDGHGYCWAFSASALAEEHLCKKNRSNCGKNISPLDMSRCGWTLLNKQEGNQEQSALSCATQNGGACFENLAPYSSLASLGCTLWDLVSGEGAKCNNQKVAALYTQWKTAKEESNCPPSPASVGSMFRIKRSLAEIQQGLIKSLRSQVPEQFLMGKSAESLFSSSSSESDFLRKVLITKSCENNRNPINASIRQNYISPKETGPRRQQLLNFIVQGLKSNSSVGIALDLGQTGFVNKILYGKESYHAVVVNGMRYNERKNRCEFQLRNSWGDGADFHGWYPVDDLQNAIFSGVYLDDR